MEINIYIDINIEFTTNIFYVIYLSDCNIYGFLFASNKLAYEHIQWNLVTVRIFGHHVKPRYIKFRIIRRFLYISTKIHIAILLFRLSLILDRCVYI